MLFDFLKFVEDLREKEDKKEVIQKYEKHFGPIEGDIKDQSWYTEYMSLFAIRPFALPEDIADDYDWDLLEQFIAASFSSEWTFEKNDDGELEFVVSVTSGDKVVVKKISELRGFQIVRLYEIYIEEQMNLQILMKENEVEKEEIINIRETKQQRWKMVTDRADKVDENDNYEEEKTEQLDDLMNQL